MAESESRGLIKSMLVVGSAEFLKILISIGRMKVLAVLLGPSGVGLLSIFNNLQGVVTQGAGLGMTSSGVRELAAARGETKTLSRVRRVLFAAHLVQGLIAMGAVWLLREQISGWLFGDATRAAEVGWIGLAILLALLAGAQTALLQGLRRIGDLSRVTVLGTLAGSVVGLVAVWLQGEDGLIWFVLVQPLASVLVALNFTRRLPKPDNMHLSPSETWHIWKPMARLGAAFMLGSLATAATLLLVRGHIAQGLGLDAAGHFSAAWSITMTYVGFLLAAMGADYYPRLAALIHDRPAMVRLMNDQAQLGLAIGGPVLLLLIGLAPWVITLLYSSEFAPAATLLQWQTVGNVFKLAGFALGFSVAAAARGKTFLFTQLHFNLVFLAILWSTLESFGVIAAGPAFAIAYLCQLTLVYVVVRRIHGFRWQPLSLLLLVLHVSLAVAVLALALMMPLVAAVAVPLLAVATGILGVRVVVAKIGSSGPVERRVARLFTAVGWPIRSTE